MQLDIISTREFKKRPISYETITCMEDEFIECSGSNLMLYSSNLYFLNKVLRKIGTYNVIDNKLLRKMNRDNYKLFISMDDNDILLCLNTLKSINNKLILYIFDCWEPMWNRFHRLFTEINPYLICFAYKKAEEHFHELNKWKTCFVPQAYDSKVYMPYYNKKNRLFIQIGRRTEYLHKLVISYLSNNNINENEDNYLYEREKGKFLFQCKTDLAKEMSKSYFFLVAPKCFEHREETGNISEVTARFYEAMACKTLCVGIKPTDTFDMLFPYGDAMIEIDDQNFGERIKELINNRERYNQIIEKNYKYVMTHHLWKNRLDMILNNI